MQILKQSLKFLGLYLISAIISSVFFSFVVARFFTFNKQAYLVENIANQVVTLIILFFLVRKYLFRRNK